MEQKIKLLYMLSDQKIWSGEALASQLGVTRATISHWVKQLESSGMVFNKVKGRGYRLLSPVQMLDYKDLLGALSPDVRGRLSLVDVSAQSPSTNDTAMNARYDAGKWKLFTTEHQTNGRGRRGRSWASPPCSNLAFSLGYKGPIPITQLYLSSLLVGFAIASELNRQFCIDAKIKWPNDIYVNDKKIAGVLCELQGSPPDDVLLVMGVGLNVFNKPDLTVASASGVTSLAQVFHGDISRTELLAHLVDSIITRYYEFKHQGAPWLLSEWSKLDLLKGRPIKVIRGDEAITGTGAGVDESGQLRLIDETGNARLFNGGEVSVRWD